jgi:lysophospholipase L1-like esterase
MQDSWFPRNTSGGSPFQINSGVTPAELQTGLATKSNLAGGNTFTGDQTILGTLSATSLSFTNITISGLLTAAVATITGLLTTNSLRVTTTTEFDGNVSQTAGSMSTTMSTLDNGSGDASIGRNLTVTGTTGLTGLLTANAGINATSHTIQTTGNTSTGSLTVSGTSGFTVLISAVAATLTGLLTGVTATFSGLINANGGLNANNQTIQTTGSVLAGTATISTSLNVDQGAFVSANTGAANLAATSINNSNALIFQNVSGGTAKTTSLVATTPGTTSFQVNLPDSGGGNVTVQYAGLPVTTSTITASGLITANGGLNASNQTIQTSGTLMAGSLTTGVTTISGSQPVSVTGTVLSLGGVDILDSVPYIQSYVSGVAGQLDLNPSGGAVHTKLVTIDNGSGVPTFPSTLNLNSTILQSGGAGTITFPPGTGTVALTTSAPSYSSLTVTGTSSFGGTMTCGVVDSTSIVNTGTASFTGNMTCGAMTCSTLSSTSITNSGTSSFIGAMTCGVLSSSSFVCSGTSNFTGSMTCGALSTTSITNSGTSTFTGAVTLTANTLTNSTGAVSTLPITTGNLALTSQIPGSSSSPTYAGLTITGNETVGGTLGVTGASTLSSATITGTLSAGSYVQSYAPIATTATIDFFGDSITAGVGATSNAFRWSTLVAAALGKTENNRAVSGAQVEDMSQTIYNTRTPGTSNTAFIMIGTNDLRFTINIDNLRRMLLSSILYAILPSANILSARSGSVTKAGTWANTGPYTTVGMFANAPYTGNSMSATVTGRFVCFASTTINSSTSINSVGWNITIDGVAQNSNPLQFINLSVVTQIGANYGPFIYLFDTLSSGATTHTITITPTVFGSYTDPAYVDWIGGFSPAQSGCSKCFVVAPGIFDYNSMWGGSETNMETYARMQRDLVRYLQYELQLPVYYVADSQQNQWLGATLDLLHPNNPGHQYIANRVLKVISTGESNYLSN